MNKYKLYTVLIFLLLGLSSSPTYSENASEVSETEDTEITEADNEETEEQEEFTINESDNPSTTEEQSSEVEEPTEEIDNAESQQDDVAINAEKPQKTQWWEALLEFAFLIACTR